jgi:hypothetical protein
MGLHRKVYAADRQREQKSEKASALLQNFFSRAITEALSERWNVVAFLLSCKRVVAFERVLAYFQMVMFGPPHPTERVRSDNIVRTSSGARAR